MDPDGEFDKDGGSGSIGRTEGKGGEEREDFAEGERGAAGQDERKAIERETGNSRGESSQDAAAHAGLEVKDGRRDDFGDGELAYRMIVHGARGVVAAGGEIAA